LRAAGKDPKDHRTASGHQGQAPASPEPQDHASPDLNRQIAYRRFQQHLLDGRMQPGQNLSQRDLVDMLGISLGALRELLPRLAAEGLLTVLPQRGIQITSVDLRMIRESYQMRLAIEREATIFAVENMPDAPLLQQRSLHVDIVERAASGVSEALLGEAQKIDSGFHDALVGATGNSILIQAYAVIAIRVRMIQLDRIRLNTVVLTPSLADHLEIIDGILARDRGRAVAAMEAHIRNARDRAVAL
jgi:DNA-binding GntR family transcriptional regulator